MASHPEADLFFLIPEPSKLAFKAADTSKQDCKDMRSGDYCKNVLKKSAVSALEMMVKREKNIENQAFKQVVKSGFILSVKGKISPFA